jgi:hypothetical protein
MVGKSIAGLSSPLGGLMKNVLPQLDQTMRAGLDIVQMEPCYDARTLDLAADDKDDELEADDEDDDEDVDEEEAEDDDLEDDDEDDDEDEEEEEV